MHHLRSLLSKSLAQNRTRPISRTITRLLSVSFSLPVSFSLSLSWTNQCSMLSKGSLVFSCKPYPSCLCLCVSLRWLNQNAMEAAHKVKLKLIPFPSPSLCSFPSFQDNLPNNTDQLPKPTFSLSFPLSLSLPLTVCLSGPIVCNVMMIINLLLFPPSRTTGPATMSGANSLDHAARSLARLFREKKRAGGREITVAKLRD